MPFLHLTLDSGRQYFRFAKEYRTVLWHIHWNATHRFVCRIQKWMNAVEQHFRILFSLSVLAFLSIRASRVKNTFSGRNVARRKITFKRNDTKAIHTVLCVRQTLPSHIHANALHTRRIQLQHTHTHQLMVHRKWTRSENGSASSVRCRKPYKWFAFVLVVLSCAMALSVDEHGIFWMTFIADHENLHEKNRICLEFRRTVVLFNFKCNHIDDETKNRFDWYWRQHVVRCTLWHKLIRR